MDNNIDSHIPDMDDFWHSFHAAVKAEKGGISAAARKHGMKPKTLLNYLDPDDETHYPRSDLLISILLGTADKTPLDILCRMNNGAFKTYVADTHDSMSTALLDAFSELSDVSRLAQEYGADGYDPKEKQHLLIEISQAERAIAIIKNSILAGVA